ncbi:MAG TPA: hypothetical protein VMU27_02940 [Candidatus Paceibacterota bacterium]|nr:hypothetical protein [Candidatus Paceibacterota bacterium]
MPSYHNSYLTRIAFGIFFLIIVFYAYFEARGLLFGPTISVDPLPSVVQAPYILVQGQTTHIDSLMVDGQPIPITESGAFQDPYILAPGANRIVFDAKDPYGNSTEKIVEIVYQVPATSSLPAFMASSTPDTSGASSTTPTSTSPLGQ